MTADTATPTTFPPERLDRLRRQVMSTEEALEAAKDVAALEERATQALHDKAEAVGALSGVIHEAGLFKARVVRLETALREIKETVNDLPWRWP